MDPNAIDALERRLADLDKVLAESAMRVDASPPHTAYCRNYQRQECEHEHRDLAQQRGEIERKLTAAKEAMNKTFRLWRRRDKQPDPRARCRSAGGDRAPSQFFWIPALALRTRPERQVETPHNFLSATSSTM